MARKKRYEDAGTLVGVPVLIEVDARRGERLEFDEEWWAWYREWAASMKGYLEARPFEEPTL